MEYLYVIFIMTSLQQIQFKVIGVCVVFQGGKLTYIDYDTKDYTFNKMVPTAYQVFSLILCCFFMWNEHVLLQGYVHVDELPEDYQ